MGEAREGGRGDDYVERALYTKRQAREKDGVSMAGVWRSGGEAGRRRTGRVRRALRLAMENDILSDMSHLRSAYQIKLTPPIISHAPRAPGHLGSVSPALFLVILSNAHPVFSATTPWMVLLRRGSGG